MFGHKKPVDSRVSLQFASWGSESEISILKPILADFEKENPDIKIDFMHIPQNYFQKIHLLFASNTAPDVIFINNQYLPIYANSGRLEDLTNYDFEFDKFYQKSLETLSWHGNIYAIPRDISNLVIYYNKDIFDKYSIPYPKDDWTFDEFLKTAQKLTHLPNIYGISFEDEPYFFLPYLTSFGVKDFSKFEDENFQKGLKFYADLRNKYHVAPRKEESASATMAQMFLQGRLGMHLSGRWLVPKYRQEASFDWDVVSFPKGVVPMDSSGWAISKSSKHKQDAARLIKYLSSKTSSEKFTESGLIVPARVDVATSKAFLDTKKPQNSQVFLSVVETSIPTPVTIDFKEIMDSLKTKTEKINNLK
jgi:multiple sugar transport system substrate-binding protein